MARNGKKNAKQVFVTGFPNFASIRIVQKIVETEPRSVVHLLVMEKDLPFAQALSRRVKKSQQRRIKFYTGDVNALDLGLAGSEYNELTGRITHIHHLALAWNYARSYRTCRELNLGGTRNLLEFAGECAALEQVVYYSTLYVSGKRRGVIREDEFEHERGFKNYWEETRYNSEKMAREYLEKGLPVTIMRLGNVVGDSRSGDFRTFNGPYQLVKLLMLTDRNLPIFLPGDCEGPSNIVPVDYVVDAVLHILENEACTGKAYHITDPYPLTTRTVFDAICSYLGRKPPTFGIPRRFYKTVLLIPGMERFAGVPKQMFDYFNHKAVHNCSNTLAALKGTDIQCPRFEAYFPIGIEYARELLQRRMEKQEEAETVDPYDRQGA